MTRKICALLQKKPEPIFAMDKAPKKKKSVTSVGEKNARNGKPNKTSRNATNG